VKTVNLTIRDIPRPVLDRLRAGAEQNRRSMQGEIVAILEAAAAAPTTRWTVAETLRHLRKMGVRTPAEAARMMRADRRGR
jgi:plasmid stability protein